MYISKKDQLKFKILLFGAEAVGKTSLILRYVKNSFSDNIRKTIGANFLMKEIDFENKHIKLIIWDIAGQSKFERMRDVYYRGSQGAIGVFDVTRPETLDEIPIWMKSIKESVKSDIPILIIGKSSAAIRNSRSTSLPNLFTLTCMAHQLDYFLVATV